MGNEHFDVIIVGSGFGGSVAARRLAEGGLRVCVLERGKAYPPDTFARTPRDMRRNFWDPSRGLQGLFNIWSFRGIDAVVSSGLGGGSLIYANVLLRMPERWFVTENPCTGAYEEWPVSRDDLEEHYDEVERALGASELPFSDLEASGYPKTAKAHAMRSAAKRLQCEAIPVKLAVSFSNGQAPPRLGASLSNGLYPNYHGEILRSTCRLCGECDLGCRYGAKNTLDHTYLSAARYSGADIRPRSEVRRLRRRLEGGFAVSYVQHDSANEGRRTDTSKLPWTTITANRLVLAAGSLGTPYLLLRNQDALPDLGPALGTRFCGNGDLLAFALWSRTRGEILDASRGPVITTAIMTPDRLDGGRGAGHFVEDAGYPEFVDWMLELTRVRSIVRRIALLGLRRLRARIDGRPNHDISADISRLVGHAGLTSRSLPLLGMGRDVPDGVMRLNRRGDRQMLDIDWTSETSKEYFAQVRQSMRSIAEALGAEFAELPRLHPRRVITVQPLGGCPMGRHPRQGVVNGDGEAWNCPGLFVADGSVMPGPVGANPSLTIAAFSDRMALRMLERDAQYPPRPRRASPGDRRITRTMERGGA